MGEEQGRPISVLHVDDEPGFADMAATFVEREDERISVDTETTVDAALERLAETDYDCIVSDYEMPGRDGIEFLEAVRTSRPDVPFILFTGKGSEEVASEAISAGATDYLQKESASEQYELLANRVRNTVEQHRSRRRADELDRVRALASDINQALVHATDRADAEQRVCEIISESDPYLFAWIGTVDAATDRLEPRRWAGTEEGYLEDISIPVGPDAPTKGPGWTAVNEERVAVTQRIQEDPEFDAWREAATSRGYRAVAAVPLLYEGTRYGVLGVYADQPDAFDETEQELLTELGSDIAHAVHSFDVRDRLRLERDRRRALFENAPSPVVAEDVDHETGRLRITDVNDAFLEVFGYDRETAIGADPGDLVVPEDGMAGYEEFKERSMAGESVVTEVERLTAEGRRTFLLHVVPFGDGSGPVDGLHAWYTDITEQRERERTIGELHETVQRLIDADSAAEVGAIATAAVKDILGMPANGVHIYDEDAGGLVPVAWTDETESIVDEVPTFAPGEGVAGTAFETGEPQIYSDISTVPERYNPETEVRSQIALPLGDHGVLVIGAPEPGAFDDIDVSLAETLAGHVTSVLNRIERESDLAQARERYRTLVDNYPDGGVFLYGEDLRCVLAGGQGLSDVGLTPEDVVGNRPRDRYPATLADEIEAHLEAAFDGETAEFDVEFGDRYYRIRTLPVGDEPVRHVMAVSQEVTERKRRQEELERYETLVESAAGGVFVQDADGRYTFVNSYIEDRSGYDREELLDEDPSILIPESDIRAIEDGIEDLLAGTRETLGFETEVTTASGETFPAEGRLALLPSEDEFRGTVGVIRDITERKERERELQRQNERLEEFAGVVSHDLRNPLNVAEGHLELAREECESDHLDDVASAVDRSIALLEDLLLLARNGERIDTLEQVDLAETVDGCWRNVATADATIVATAEGHIRADPSRCKQLLENLFRNAVQHGGDDVTVRVGDLDDGFFVEDDGPGIPEEDREQAFQIGYSTASQGTGFGLDIVRSIADAHGWSVAITDAADGGARFEISGVDVVGD